jgi:opacity protein-like surface antigen
MMTKIARRAAGFFVLILIAGAASAQSDKPWDGVYVGVNMGEAHGDACGASSFSGAKIDSASGTALTNCPSGTFGGGLQIGDNFQMKRLFWGLAADLDLWSGKSDNPSLKWTGAEPPPGTYSLSGKLNPTAVIIAGPRIGYAGDLWMPYLRVGGVLATGSGNSNLNFVPAGATASSASFSGGKNYNSTGWAAGGGTEIGLNGAWSISAEYLHVSLGKGSNSAAGCSGTAAACAAFAGISLDTIHESYTANIIRIGINYWFRYWIP